MCICSHNVLYWKKSQFSQSKAAKDLCVITASSIGNEKEMTEFSQNLKGIEHMLYAHTDTRAKNEHIKCSHFSGVCQFIQLV
jgi:hypothetical protein